MNLQDSVGQELSVGQSRCRQTGTLEHFMCRPVDLMCRKDFMCKATPAQGIENAALQTESSVMDRNRNGGGQNAQAFKSSPLPTDPSCGRNAHVPAGRIGILYPFTPRLVSVSRSTTRHFHRDSRRQLHLLEAIEAKA